MGIEIKTGLEGLDFRESEVAACPVTGWEVETSICERGQAGASCAYFGGFRELERAPGKEPKRILVCNAPRLISLRAVMRPSILHPAPAGAPTREPEPTKPEV